MDQLRRRSSRRHLDVDDPGLTDEELREGPDVVADAEDRSRALRVRAVLDSMDTKYRVPLVMCDVDGFSYAEIAEELEIGLSATKMRIKRGRELFRARFDKRSGSSGAAGEK